MTLDEEQAQRSSPGYTLPAPFERPVVLEAAPAGADKEGRRLVALRDLAILDTVSEEKYDDLTRLAAYICGTPMSTISLVDEDRQWFKSKVGLDAEGTPRSEAFCSYTVQSDTMLIVEDATLDKRFCDFPQVISGAIRFYAGAPIQSPNGYNVGTLCVLDTEPRHLTDEQKQALQVLGRQAAAYLLIHAQVQQLMKNVEERLAVEQELRESKEMLEQANSRLLTLARTDALTGLANRRVIEASLHEKQQPDADPALSLLMIDVDHFKRINDTLGHEVGDRVLQRMAEVLRCSTRGNDTVCRYGGEEFVLLMPGADHDVAVRRAEQLRLDIVSDPQAIVPITVSIGVATAHCDTWGVGVSRLLAASDEALYIAKHEGRNCVRSARPVTSREEVPVLDQEQAAASRMER